MDKVKALIEAGLTIPTAIKQALGRPLKDVAETHHIAPPILSDVINGNRRATDAQIDALITELGGTREEWLELLWLAAKPQHVEPVRAIA